MPTRSSILVAAVNEGDVDTDFYPVSAYLRDSSIPNVRPLYNVFQQHYDDRLKAAALVHHPAGTYELVMLHNHMLKRFVSELTRTAPDYESFINRFT